MNNNVQSMCEPLELARLEQAPLGNSFVLHSPLSDAILLSNAVGLTIYSALLKNIPPPDIAKKLSIKFGISKVEAANIYDEIVESWRTAGLLDTEKPEFSAPATYNPIKTHYDTLTVCCNNIIIRIECSAPLLSTQLKEILKHYISDNKGNPTVTISTLNTPDGIGVFADKEPLWELCNLDLARNIILREVAIHLSGKEQTSAILHASCVANDKGECIIITNKSGYGKSTLTAGLAAAGLKFVSDDILPLHNDGESVISFPTPLGLKHGAWNLKEVEKFNFKEKPNADLPRTGVIYRNIPTSISLGNKLKVIAIIFPHFNEDNTNELNIISPENSLHKIIEAGARTNHMNPSILSLAKLLDKTPSYELNYSSSDYSIETCLNILK